MTTEPHAKDSDSPTKGTAEHIIHDFVRDAVARLTIMLRAATPEFEDDIGFERGEDGHFREHKKRTRRLRPALNDEWLHSLPDYQKSSTCLTSDALIGSHLNCLVGTSISRSRIESDSLLIRLIYAMVNDDGKISFTSDKFYRKWQEFNEFCSVDAIGFKMVAVLPNLVLSTVPIRLNDELCLDRLTDEEVTRCYHVGVIRPNSLRFPFIPGETAMGIRSTTLLLKLIQSSDEQLELPDAKSEGVFGKRPLLRGDLIIDDVLAALRLFRPTQIRPAGHASWTDSTFLNSGTQYQILGQWPYGGAFHLSNEEVSSFLELWHLLEEGVARFGFSVRRFTLAFDRRLIADRIVDLIIAAEALFLGELDDKYRGELRFRFALRAAKFIEHTVYSEKEIFRMMRQAYDARSAIVHGGTPKDIRLPGNKSTDLAAFVDVIENLVRLGLRKALSMKDEGRKLRQAEYWDALVLSKDKSNP